ncbi:MAG: capsular biosynthesis protein [Campylobacteraceae bacterium]|jgi:capsular polysaccharide export protein|nr:capsular biosynthesis protein [Campylobacteraceae bacterium]
MNSIGALKDKNILLLQGPMGTFFKRLDKIFRKRGAKTYKIALNAADWFFSNKDNVISYKDKPEKWKKFIGGFLSEKRIDKIFLFGDCRFYQKIAIKAADNLGIEVFVFEEGYIRPDFITLEKYGVNDNSKLPRAKEFYENLPEISEQTKTLPMKNSLYNLIISATTYYLIANAFMFLYPNYIHHREFSAIKEGFYGIRNFIRKIIYAQKDRPYNKRFKADLSKKYFFVPLQTYSDAQIKKHSQFKSLEEFIEMVLVSFARFADKECFIIFKHHPLDRGRVNYAGFISSLAKKLGVEKRVIALYETHIPNALKNALGTVTINSTVGLSSLYHGTPTITMGKAIYDIKSLTCKGVKLDNFWQNAVPPERDLFQKFRAFLIQNSQINSSFYGKIGDLEKAGLQN